MSVILLNGETHPYLQLLGIFVSIDCLHLMYKSRILNCWKMLEIKDSREKIMTTDLSFQSFGFYPFFIGNPPEA